MPETVEILQSYDWPGNVREMKNVMEHALVFADNTRILPSYLPDYIVKSAGKQEKKTQEAMTSQYEDEQTKIMNALRDNRYNLTKTAKQLGISRGTLYKKMEKYQIK
jgi:transcriptional regulator with PAS, ATPase and Fis domain